MDATFVNYMRAAIRAQHPINLDAWDDETLRSVFHVLPTPAIPFATWQERMIAQTPTAPELLDANDRFIAFARELPGILHLE